MKKKEFNEMEFDIPDEIDLTHAVRSPFPKLLKQQVTKCSSRVLQRTS